MLKRAPRIADGAKNSVTGEEQLGESRLPRSCKQGSPGVATASHANSADTLRKPSASELSFNLGFSAASDQDRCSPEATYQSS